ncbi:uncharacterized protein Dvir_GJ27142, isoform C [Drosophila virilis]|nr:mitochondrial sodium/calcium exchanger protein isoform X2 [Drosophila virilis]XP_032295076.1 mitochondrial sodium/calcium exchanger protein isoform X2 [Drosophila virilis]KRF83678.1 uncharacterized protein Dvir_GJ27142, isoform C [Drosophila virilis]
MQTDGVMTMPEIIGILFFFLLYIIINVVDVYLVSLAMKAYKNELEELNSMKQTEEIAAKREILKKKYNSIAADHRVHILKRKPTYISNNYDKFSFITTRSTVHVTLERDSASRSDMYNMDASRNANLFTDFFCAFRPVALADWRKANMLMRIFYIVRAPAVIVCVIYIPLVDYELDKNGWSKLLNCLHIVINPAITIIFGKALMFRDRSRLWYYNIPDDCIYGFYSFAITIPIAIFTFWHSRTSAPPAYHWLYIIMNLTGSMFLTFHCACEISLIMDVCGHILKVPSDFMGVTVKAVADSIPDLIVNTSMALLGYEKMAYAASIGSSFCALILTTSTVMAAKSLTGKIVTASSMTGRYGDNAYILIILGILSTLLWTALLNFNARRSVGLFSMFIYLLYLIFVVLIRAGIIHQFAYDSFLSDAYEP